MLLGTLYDCGRALCTWKVFELNIELISYFLCCEKCLIFYGSIPLFEEIPLNPVKIQLRY